MYVYEIDFRLATFIYCNVFENPGIRFPHFLFLTKNLREALEKSKVDFNFVLSILYRLYAYIANGVFCGITEQYLKCAGLTE